MTAEFKTERDKNYDGTPVLRVFFRAPGERRWRKRVVFPGEGATVDMLLERAQEIADKLLAGDLTITLDP